MFSTSGFQVVLKRLYKCNLPTHFLLLLVSNNCLLTTKNMSRKGYKILNIAIFQCLQSGKDTTLDFHDSGQDDVLFEQGNMQTHTFTDFPNSAQDDDEGDKSEVCYKIFTYLMKIRPKNNFIYLQ